MIKVIGLGNSPSHATLQAINAIKDCSCVIVKTAKTKTFEYFTSNNIECICLDFLYENAQDFDCLDKNICNFIIEKSQVFDNICYCVNGSGYDDRSVVALSKLVEIEIIAGVCNQINTTQPSLAHITISAYELVNMKGWNYDTRMSLLITDIDNNFIASEIKLILSDLLGDEQTGLLNGQSIKIYELDRQNCFDYSCAIFFPPLDIFTKLRHNMQDLMSIMYTLRGENGCPWDKAQTHNSIRHNAIEEAYELVEAINNDDLDNLIEETGDVLLQAIFHCVIGEACGEYNLNDSLSVLCRKLIDRHTHIFGGVVANNANEALSAWENAKAKEKSHTSLSNILQSIPKALPSLHRAKKAQSIAKKMGYEFENFTQVLNKINEEVEEFATADTSQQEIEGGDILFAVVNSLRWKGIDPEVALNRAVSKFITRLEYIDKHYKDTHKLSPEQLDKLWEEAKNATSSS